MKRGFSLVEALLACALFLLIGMLATQVLLPMAPGLVRGSQQAGLQQMACVATEKLAVQLEGCTPTGVELLAPSPGEPPVRLAARAVIGVGAGGGQQLDPYAQLYWFDATAHRVWQEAWQQPPDPTSQTNVHLLPDSADFDAALAAPARVLLGGVSQFQATLVPGDNGATSQVRLSLTLQSPSQDSRPPESFSLQRTVVLHNQDYQP